jgi:hypothetical protein
MKTGILTVCLALTMLPGLAFASEATHTMAGMLVDMKHFPTDANKASLADIAANEAATADEKTLAQIIARIAHQATAEDKAALGEMLGKADSGDDVQAVAKAVMNMNHTVQPDDMAALKAIAATGN